MFNLTEIERDPFACIARLSALVGELITENRALETRLAVLESASRRFPVDDERVVPTVPTLN